MTHLGLGSSLEEPWLDLPGGYGVGVALPGGRIELLGRLCRTVLGGAYYLACLPWGVMTLPYLGGARGMRGAVFPHCVCGGKKPEMS